MASLSPGKSRRPGRMATRAHGLCETFVPSLMDGLGDEVIEEGTASRDGGRGSGLQPGVMGSGVSQEVAWSGPALERPA